MFIRWQKKGNNKYGHLEERKRVEGKVVTHYVAYLGTTEKAPGRLFNLREAGVIDTDQYASLCAALPEAEKGPGPGPDILEALKAELDTLTEVSIMKEFPHMSAHFAHLDGVRHMLKKLEGIKGKFPEVWTSFQSRA